jgi:DNA repair protein RadA/Sms
MKLDSSQEIRMDAHGVPMSLRNCSCSILYGGTRHWKKHTLLQISLKLLSIKLYMFQCEESQNNKMRRKNHKQWQLLHPYWNQNPKYLQANKNSTWNVIIDSIQTLHTDYIESTPGSISQIGNHCRTNN